MQKETSKMSEAHHTHIQTHRYVQQYMLDQAHMQKEKPPTYLNI